MKTFTFPFGKHKGLSLAEINRIKPSYLPWVLREFDKDSNIVFEIKKYLAGVSGTPMPEVDIMYVNPEIEKLWPMEQTNLFEETK